MVTLYIIIVIASITVINIEITNPRIFDITRIYILINITRIFITYTMFITLELIRLVL